MSKRKRTYINHDHEDNKKHKPLVKLEDFIPRLANERGKHSHFINNCYELINRCYQRACDGYTFYHFRNSYNLSSLNSVSYMLDLGVFVESDCGWEKSCCSHGPNISNCTNCSNGITILRWDNIDTLFCNYLMDQVRNSYVDNDKLDMIIREVNFGDEYVVYNLDLRYNEIQILKKADFNISTEMFRACNNGCLSPVCKRCLGFTKVSCEQIIRLGNN